MLNDHISGYPRKHGAELETPISLRPIKHKVMKGRGSKGQVSFFYSNLQWYTYRMRLDTQRISGHMWESALEYTKSSAPHCLQTIYYLKQDKKQQNLKRRKSREMKLGLAQNHYFFVFFSPYHLSPHAAPTYLQGCPNCPSGHRSASPDEVFITASPGVFPPVHGRLN